MSERIGICEQCGQKFGGIPDSVTALKVKCTECGGAVAIPPLPEAPVAATPPSVEVQPAAAPTPEPPKPAAPVVAPPEDKPLAAPLGGNMAKGHSRPESAKPVDRNVAAPKKSAAPKVAKPLVPLKPVVKVAKPITPLKPVAKPAKAVVPLKKPGAPTKPVVPVKPVAKPSAPVKPVSKAALAPKVVAKATPKAVPPGAAPVAKKPPVVAPKPAAPKKVVPIAKKPATPLAKPAAAPALKKKEVAKPTAAEIIAKAKAKKAAEAKPSAADIIAKAKAKRSETSSAPAEKKSSAADIIAKAKAKREGGAKPLEKPGAKKVAVASGRPKVAVAGAGSRKRPAGGGGSSSTRSRRRRQEEEEVPEKSKAPLLIVGVLVLGGGGFGAWALMKGDSEEASSTEDVVMNVPAESTSTPSGAAGNSNTSAATTPASSAPEQTDLPTDITSSTGNEAAANVEAPAEAVEKPKPVAAASSDFTLPAAGERINTRGVTDAALIRLDQVTPLGKASDTSADEWNEAVEDLALYLEDSGASSNRAGNRLAEDYPRAAYPAIINAMLKADYTSSEGLYQVAALNNLLLRIGTKDLSWRQTEFFDPGTEEWNKAVVFNKKVVAAWHNLWVDTYANSLPAWNGFSKVAAEAAAAEQADDAGGIVGPDEDMFD